MSTLFALRDVPIFEVVIMRLDILSVWRLLLAAWASKVPLPDFTMKSSFNWTTIRNSGVREIISIHITMGILQGDLFGSISKRNVMPNECNQYSLMNSVNNCCSLLFPEVSDIKMVQGTINMTTSFLSLCNVMNVAQQIYCPFEEPRRFVSMSNTLPKLIRLGTDEKIKYHVDYCSAEICTNDGCCDLRGWYEKNRMSKYYHRFDCVRSNHGSYGPCGRLVGKVMDSVEFNKLLKIVT